MGSYNQLHTGDRNKAMQICLAKQFWSLNADCLVVGGSQRQFSVFETYPVNPLCPEGGGQTNDKISLAKQFWSLNADCLVVGEARKYPVNPLYPEGGG